ncbi:MAG TPA: D-alanine--D-alanine ligase [Gemmatimonadaceae bacterium]
MKITVLLGGASAERDVSIASGLRVVDALRSRGHRVTALDPATGVLDAAAERAMAAAGVKTAPPTLEALRGLGGGTLRPSFVEAPAVRDADVVFLALHGGQGEDGTVQALLEMAGVPYTGSGPMASAIAMDKDVSKRLFRQLGVQTADWRMVTGRDEGRGTRDEILREALGAMGLPIVVKPSKQGSTVGLTVVKRAADLSAAVTEAFRYDDEVMLERFVPGRELTVGVLGDEALAVGEIIPKKEIYDYECKYTAGMAVEEFPAKLSDAETRHVQEQGVLAFRALKLRGYARIDFRRTPEGEFHCLEANTLPGMTELSLIPQSAAALGISFADLCERIVRLALDGRRRSEEEGAS